ncbi:hypothetical protein [Ferruginibacter sp. SUN106]|uniref:hypothetical protein n=1 Tax=Ferruginibacter sp. SUN106 TaxID=2978348 RepID=UPI003D365247
MKKGILYGIIFSVLVLVVAFSLLSIGFTMDGPGIGVWLSLILLIGAIITGIFFLKNKSATIVYSAKTAIVLTATWLLLFLIAFFR